MFIYVLFVFVRPIWHDRTNISQMSKFIFVFTEDVPYDSKNGPFTICDYGTADGGVSLPLLKECVGTSMHLHV